MTATVKNIRMYTTDAGRRFIRSRDDGEPANRTRIASFLGSAYSAEREGDDLHIYHHSAEMIPTSVTGDDIGASLASESAAEKTNRIAQEKLKASQGLKGDIETESPRMSTGTSDRASDPRSPANLQKQIEAWRTRNWPQEELGIGFGGRRR
jgi:hypothetical protein